MTTATDHQPAPPLALDLAYGVRNWTATCPVCQRPVPVPATAGPRYELETLDGDGDVVCLLCADKTHHSLRLAVGLLNAALDDRAAGRDREADEALRAVLSGLELAAEAAGALPTPEPNRAARRSKQRGRRR
jgi:hypothetical protein